MTSTLSFVDTNVLVYAHDTSEPEKYRIAGSLIDDLWRSESGVISTQVLQEFYNVVTRKFDPPISKREAREIVAAYSAWPVVQVDAALIIEASELDERHKLSFWDALIIAAARRGGASRLYTEDTPSAPKLAGVSIVDPFAERT